MRSFNIKKAAAVILSLVMIFSMTACKDGKKAAKIKIGKANVSASAKTEKKTGKKSKDKKAESKADKDGKNKETANDDEKKNDKTQSGSSKAEDGKKGGTQATAKPKDAAKPNTAPQTTQPQTTQAPTTQVAYTYNRNSAKATQLYNAYMNYRVGVLGMNTLTMDSEMQDAAMRDAERQAEIMRNKGTDAKSRMNNWIASPMHCDDIHSYDVSSAHARGDVIQTGYSLSTCDAMLNAFNNSPGHYNTLYSDGSSRPLTGCGVGVVEVSDGLQYVTIITFTDNLYY